MNNTTFAFLIGVVVGVGGTILTNYILDRKSNDECIDDDEYVIEDYRNQEINPTKPICDSIPSIYYAPTEKPVDYGKYSTLAEKYNPKEDPEIQKIIDDTINEMSDVKDEHHNIFDSAEIVDEDVKESFTKKDAIPPNFRNKKIVGSYDIEEISREQYRDEALNYDKHACTYFINDDIVAGVDDDLDIMDIPTTVGQTILDRFEELDVRTLYVSNISTEVDYEIVLEDDRSYQEVLATLKKDYGDEVCQDETT